MTEFDPNWENAFIPEEHWHFHRQLLARYGRVLARGEFQKIVTAIKNGTAIDIDWRTDGTTIYAVKIQGEYIFVMATGHRLLTAWPPSAEMYRKRKEPKRRGAASNPSTGG